MKKVCIFCSLSSFATGMPISAYKLAVGLAGRGAGVFVVLPEEGELADRLRGAGIAVAVIPFKRVKKDFWKRPWQVLPWVSAGWRLYRHIRGNGIGIVHFSDVIDAPFYPFARIAGAKAVAHVRVCVDAPAVRRLYRAWTHVFCQRIIVVSKFVKRYYGFGRKASVVYNPGPDREIFDPKRYAGGGIDTDVVNTNDGHCEQSEAIYNNVTNTDIVNTDKNVIDNGINIDTDVVNTNTNTNTNVDNGAPVVIAVSSFRRDKGLHNFVEIAAEIAERRGGVGRGVRFVIVGGMVSGHEDYYYEVMESARRVGVSRLLTVTGNVRHEEVAAFLAGASVFIHAPDWEEALGGAVLEAMAMGAAVVAYDSGGVGECFRNGASGYLVNRGDKAGAAMRATSLLNKPPLRKKMAANAKKELDERFSQESYINGVLAVYVQCR